MEVEKLKYFEDFTVGEKFITRGRTITEADIVNFAALSGDWYPLHVDVEYARNTIFGERIAHGLLVLSAASGLFPLYDMAIVAFYGVDRLRFRAPTRIGDTIHVESEVVDSREKEFGGVVTFRQSIVNQRGEKVAVMDLKILIASKS
jgi:acyl dehydratase